MHLSICLSNHYLYISYLHCPLSTEAILPSLSIRPYILLTLHLSSIFLFNQGTCWLLYLHISILLYLYVLISIQRTCWLLYLSISLSNSLSIYLSTCLSFSIYLSIYQSDHRTCWPVCPRLRCRRSWMSWPVIQMINMFLPVSGTMNTFLPSQV